MANTSLSLIYNGACQGVINVKFFSSYQNCDEYNLYQIPGILAYINIRYIFEADMHIYSERGILHRRWECRLGELLLQ